eukprot:CAMPEP_0198501080 /NCGR_PEP_ID=MMETSP1462-20131121/8508_1 /TAXON_ID=1333877 /ORGANISM="Brandtodinium nutriculum, Strain RCC3387" /LENGTH=345 /DNA_ID=CAMNT_0044230109 /DNA_START=117 /DNA_END=1151 /DNA_ORIENTATION=-
MRAKEEEAFHENDELHARVSELERMNRELMAEQLSSAVAMTPRNACRRVNTGVSGASAPNCGDLEDVDSDDGTDSDLEGRRAQQLWEKAFVHARLLVRKRKAARLQLQLIASERRCEGLAAQVENLTCQVSALASKSAVAQAALASRDELIRESRLLHQQEKLKLFDTIQQLEEQLAVTAAFGDGCKAGLLSEELADAMRNTISMRSCATHVENEINVVSAKEDDLSQANMHARALEVSLLDAVVAKDSQTRARAELSERVQYLEGLLAAIERPEDDDDHGADDENLWQAIVELQRLLVLAKKDAATWQERANQPLWQRFTSAFCTTSREDKPDKHLRVPPPCGN